MVEEPICSAPISPALPIAGFSTVACHTDANQHGECWLQVLKEDGSELLNGGSFTPVRETLTLLFACTLCRA